MTSRVSSLHSRATEGFLCAEKGAASRTEPVERSWRLRHGCVSMSAEPDPLFEAGGGENEAARMGLVLTAFSFPSGGSSKSQSP